MSRYTGANCRRCRTVGEKLFLKSKKCYTAKCILERRASKPGQHGKSRKKSSEYCIQLMEKQKLKQLYGMSEKQFHLLFEKAARMKGITGHNLLILLERRLDNVMLRAGFASSRKQARQFVAHGHVKLNGKKVDIPSCLIDAGDKLEVLTKEKTEKMVKASMEFTAGKPNTPWMTVNPEKLTAEITKLPSVEDIDNKINVQLIVELYSK